MNLVKINMVIKIKIKTKACVAKVVVAQETTRVHEMPGGPQGAAQGGPSQSQSKALDIAYAQHTHHTPDCGRRPHDAINTV